MSDPRPRSVLLDTNAWSWLYWQAPRAQIQMVAEWRNVLHGAEVLIAAQTRGEVLFGALKAGWGDRNLNELRRRLDQFTTIPVLESVVEEFARVRADGVRGGHAIAAKDHMGDAWIAATAIAYGLELLSNDGIFVGVPGLNLV